MVGAIGLAIAQIPHPGLIEAMKNQRAEVRTASLIAIQGMFFPADATPKEVDAYLKPVLDAMEDLDVEVRLAAVATLLALSSRKKEVTQPLNLISTLNTTLITQCPRATVLTSSQKSLQRHSA